MGMREYPSSGYVLAIKDVYPLINEEGLEALAKASNDADKIGEVLDNFWPSNFPKVSEVYIPSDTDTVDEPMQEGEVYLIFAEEDLYIKQETPALVNLDQTIGKKPELRRWSVWG